MKLAFKTITTIAACAVIAAVSGQLYAQPKTSYDEARRLYDQFDKTIFAVGLWDKKKQPERTQLIQAAMRHRERIEKLLGATSRCANAAAFHVAFVGGLNAIGRAKDGIGNPTHFELMMALASAEQFGNHRAACYEQVEELDTPKR